MQTVKAIKVETGKGEVGQPLAGLLKIPKNCAVVAVRRTPDGFYVWVCADVAAFRQEDRYQERQCLFAIEEQPVPDDYVPVAYELSDHAAYGTFMFWKSS
jgi:hypothetical protein